MRMHMLTKTNEGDTKVSDYLKSLETPEVKPIPKDEKPKIKDEEPTWKDKKNDDANEYEYSNKTDEDDTNW